MIRRCHPTPFLSTCIIIWAIAGGALGQNTLYVSPTGHDWGLGSYADPLATILEGIGRAAPNDTISLFDGIYQGAGNRDIVLPEFPLVIRSESGDPDYCIIDCQGTIRENHRAFTANAGQDTTTVLRGIKITGGRVRDHGGALLLAEGASLLAEDCNFDANFALFRGGAVMKYGNPGGTYARKPVFRRCIFKNNEADEGGAIYVWYPCAIWITDGEFAGNTANRGGALYTYFDTRALIERTVFRDNVATDSGGAIDMSMEQYPEINLCTFRNNEAVRGGAIANRLGYSKKRAREKSYGGFSDCAFEDNTAEEGGAYYAYNQSAYSFQRCTFSDNFASTNGGAVKEVYDNESSYTECLFVGNIAGAGGAFFRDDLGDVGVSFSSRITRCTLVANAAFAGGAIAQTGVTTGSVVGDPWGYIVSNTIFAFGTGGGAIAVENGRAPQLGCVDIYGNGGGDWTTPIFPMYGINGNFREDPCFCDLAGGNYTLCAASPCLPWLSPGQCTERIGLHGLGCGSPADVDLPDPLPVETRLLGGRPNPFNPVTVVAYELRSPAVVDLRVFDVGGRLVQVLEDRRPRGPGRHEAVWRGRDRGGSEAAAGVYLVRMEAGGFVATERVTLLR